VVERVQALRAGRAKPAGPIQVAVPPDFDFGWASRFLSARMVPSIEMVSGDGLERVVWLDPESDDPRAVAISIEYQRRAAGASPRTGERATSARFLARSAPEVPVGKLRSAVVGMFDLDADLNEFAEIARRDPILDSVVGKAWNELRLLQLLDPFEALVRAILGQQVSLAAARTLTDRLVKLVATPAPRLRSGDIIPLARPRFAFPRPEAVAELGKARLRTIGLTGAKAAAVHAAGAAVANGQIDFGELRRSQPEQTDQALRSLPGVGAWTAAYVRLRGLGDRDAFPVADLGLIRALGALGVARSRMQATAEQWRPWRGYATLHLWKSLRAAPELTG